MSKIQSLIVLLTIITFSAGEEKCNSPPIKTRRQWGGAAAKSVDYQTLPVEYVIVHHTVSGSCSKFSECANRVQGIQNYHMNDLNWNDIGYNFLIGNDGNVYDAVGWHKIGAHTRGYNSKSIGIAFIGNFNDELPTPEAIKAAKDLLAFGVCSGELSARYKLLGGRQVISTQSPGLMLFNDLQDWDNWTSAP